MKTNKTIKMLLASLAVCTLSACNSGGNANVANSNLNSAKVHTSAPATSNGLVVGYLSNSYGIGSSIYTTISEAAQAGYNTVVVAFGVVNQTNPVQFYGDQFLAYTSWQTLSACPAAKTAIVQDIQNAKANYGLKYALVSVGGANNTFNIQGADLTVVAKNIVTFLNTYGLDGIDFDLEVAIDGAQLDTLIKNIRALKPDVIISAAPQANSVVAGSTTSVSLVTGGTAQNYNQAIESGDFDYI